LSGEGLQFQAKRVCDQGCHRVEIWVDEDHPITNELKEVGLKAGAVVARCRLCGKLFELITLEGCEESGMLGGVVAHATGNTATFGEPVGPRRQDS
jgi:hypothetical protein